MARKVGNSSVDRHNARAAEFARNEKRFQDSASSYISDKGYTDSSMEAVRRAAKANKYRPKVRIGQHEQEI